jgi:hypothetical protein
MHTRASCLSLVVTLMVFTSIASVASGATISINITPNAEQEAVLLMLINRECQRLVASGESIPGFCSVNPDGTCTCDPSDTQLSNTVKKLYLEDHYLADRRKLYTDYGRELGILYPNLPKATRDICDTAVGRPGLP